MRIIINWWIFFFIIILWFTKQLELYLILMIFIIIHELGHLICGLALGFKVERIMVKPLGAAIIFKSKTEDYNKKVLKANMVIVKKMIIASAGPIVNIAICLLFFLCDMNFDATKREIIIYSNLLISFFNLVPIYPLDGGRILNGVVYIFFGKVNGEKVTYKMNNFLIVAMTMLASILIYYYKNFIIILVVILLWNLVKKENEKYRLHKRIYSIINDKNSQQKNKLSL